MRALFCFACVAGLGCLPPLKNEPDGQEAAPARVYDDVDIAFEVPGERPVDVFVPSSYDGTTALPLVLFLHGYGATGAQMDRYVGLGAFAEDNDFLFATPDGTLDSQGKGFWNATSACCDFDGSDVDDSAFLRGVIDGAKEQANVDAQRVFVIGHSNGAFMAQRLACDHADVIAGVVSLAGAADGSGSCAPSAAVAVAEVHGTDDDTVPYRGGTLGAVAFPGAVASAEMWAELDGCELLGLDDPLPIDIDANLPGADTTITRYEHGCRAGGAAELWTTSGGTHIPVPNQNLLPALWDFLLAHPKP